MASDDDDDLDAFFDEVDEVEQEAAKNDDEAGGAFAGAGESAGETIATSASVEIKDEANIAEDDERPAKKARTEIAAATATATEPSIGNNVAKITTAAANTATRGTVVVSKGAVVASSAPTSTSASAIGTGVGASDKNGVYQITVPDKALPQTNSSQSQIPPPPPPPPPRTGMHGYGVGVGVGVGGPYNGYNNAGGANANTNAAAAPKKPAIRMAAGKTWTDETLSDFPENDFRLFVGNLAKELDEEALGEAFRSKYDSFVMARVIYNKISGESKGYGFVSVMDPKDCAKAIREMDGSWLGNRPIKVKLSDWKERDLREVRKSKGKKGKGGRGGRGGRGRRR